MTLMQNAHVDVLGQHLIRDFVFLQDVVVHGATSNCGAEKEAKESDPWVSIEPGT